MVGTWLFQAFWTAIPSIGRGRLRLIADSGWKLLLPLGFLINGRQKIGNCRFIRQFH